MLTEMTRRNRLRRTLAFAYVMSFCSAAAFTLVPAAISVPGAVLAFHGVLWAVLASSTHAELARLRLIIETKGGAIEQRSN